MEKQTLNNSPDSNSFWRGIGGNFDSFPQILNEFVDNAISNLISNRHLDLKLVIIEVIETEKDIFKIKITDTGTGIENLDSAFSLGNTEGKTSSLNEHGFGMKHALAAANKSNDNWVVMTKKEEEDFFYRVSAPYDINKQLVEKVSSGEWGSSFSSGTIIEFEVEKSWLKTITKGLRGSFTRLDTIMEVLAEDLGFYYSYFIKDKGVNITVQFKELNEDLLKIPVKVIEPNVKESINPGRNKTKIDLGDGEVTLEYDFSSVEESDYKRHYRANMSTSGVEIRVNGRLLAANIFNEIWAKEKHNTYNHLLIRINVISTDSERLPTTTTTKGGFRKDDYKLDAIYEWIRSKLPEPRGKDELADSELDLFKKLQEIKENTLKEFDPALVLESQMRSFTSLDEDIRMDLYQSFQNEVTIYEGKKNKSSPLNVYQLLMYWDGLVYDHNPPKKGVLIAAEHPESVRILVDEKNKTKDVEGNLYKLELQTWRENNINYPN